MSLSIDNKEISTIHFVGLLGAGMSAIAQYLAWSGCTITGSDRQSDTGNTSTREKMEAAGCTLYLQDGSGITASTQAVVVSTAIEKSNADIAAAEARGIPVYHRAQILAAIANSRQTVAVAGTSGKSTVAAVIFHILHACGKKPSVITGAGLNSLRSEGLIGNAFKGSSDILIIEADESDGSLVNYTPAISLLLNCSKDHKEIVEIQDLFKTLAQQSKMTIKNEDDENLRPVPAQRTFGFSPGADYGPDGAVSEKADGIACTLERTNCTFPYPGRHNAQNLVAAFAVCRELGCTPAEIAAASATYGGIERRFDMLKSPSGITVIDDYAHNPEKIRAALTTAQGLADKVVALFQPHGFGPTKFLFNDLVAMFNECLRECDTLILTPIYYAGGTADKSICSYDLASAIAKLTKAKVFSPVTRNEALPIIIEHTDAETMVLSMGARDPGLGAFAKMIAEVL